MSLTLAALKLVALAAALPSAMRRPQPVSQPAPVLADPRLATADAVHRRLRV